MRERYTDRQMIAAIKTSRSIRQVLIKIGLKAAGGNYNTVKRAIKKFNLKVNMVGQAYLRGKTHSWGLRIPLKKILVKETSYKGGSYKVKGRLLLAGILKNKCYCCDGTEWLGKPIPLELEHINGDNKDFRIQNLRLLCPNCHTLTKTYRGKNIKINVPKGVHKRVRLFGINKTAIKYGVSKTTIKRWLLK